MNISLHANPLRLGLLKRSLAFLAMAMLTSTVSAQLVDISSAPLYGGRQPHPNVAVTTSVEFPTVGSAYLNVPYVRATAYLGYFDNSKCYVYNTTSGGYFSVTATANTNHECSSAFSGNFMNWVTMSAIDEFRYAMTGGNRDSESGPNNGTIIMRAYLPDGSVSGVPDFYGLGSNFPKHTITTGGQVDGVSSSASTAVLDNTAGNHGGTIYIKNCKAQVYFGSQDQGSCANPQNGSSYGTYNVRINVCDSTEGPVRTDLCLQYGGSLGKYKPVGQTQINAARMRFSVFGYLMDRNTTGYTVPSGCDDGTGWNRCRYGGVLRAPMKYVGPVSFDANQTQSTNTRTEIATDGSLVADPEGNAASAGGTNSGFINYINKFGASGVYKRLDPGGEMFYEAIRYFQNLGPTSLAWSGTYNNAVKDNFPLTTTWIDPIGSICSANYIINLSDSNMWDDTYLPGYNGVPTVGFHRPVTRVVEGGLDAVAWSANIAALESSSSTSTITTNDHRPNLATLMPQNTGASDGSRLVGSYLAAGAAFWANVNDIRTDLAGKQTIKTISFDVGEATVHPELAAPFNNIDIHDRQLYLMGKYGGFNNTIDRTTDTFPNPFWATNPAAPLGVAIRTNSEWEDSAGSASPANYLLASDPTKLINGLRAAFARINAQTGTLSGAALTSANLTFGSAGAYVATFDPARWAGSVQFDSLSVDTNGNLVVSTTPIWDAGTLLTTRCGTVASGSTTCSDTDTSVNKRNILTTIKPLLGTRTAAPFTTLGIAPDLTYLGYLATNPTTGLPDLLGSARLNYLRGYRGDEASSAAFRARDSAMGDIINSGPVFVGPPTAAIPDSDYQAFFATNASRTAAVYVGANDGMLHALRATDGFELFSYIPGYSAQDLNDLTNPGYAHQVYVDTVPKVQEVKLGSTWKTVLVGANGNGAQGIFGLDVTDPTTFGTSKVLFEFSDVDDADFGSVTSAPEIAKLWVSGTASAPVYRYFAVVTGYNNKRTTVNNRTDANVTTDTNNKGVLFLIALDHTLGTTWVSGTDYYKFTFPASIATLANGLGPVTLLASKSGDGTTAYMYFGDIQGNLWKFATNTGSPSTWAPALGSTTTPLPIFIAKDSLGNRQPITARPELASGPFGSTLVFFGTGEFLGQTDLTLPGAIQSEYSLLDINPSVLITRLTDLVPRTGATVACATTSGTCVTVTGSAFAYTGPSAKKGWYIDFPSSASLGERSVTKPAVRTGLLTFTTLTLSNDLCTPGNGFIYQLDALTGLPLAGSLNNNTGGYASTVGIPGPPRVVDLTITSGQNQATGEVINKKTQTTLVSGTSGKIDGFGAKDSVTGQNIQVKVPPTQRINWRELTNWNDRTGH
jgi:type IV pilus assembly protein PilY1